MSNRKPKPNKPCIVLCLFAAIALSLPGCLTSCSVQDATPQNFQKKLATDVNNLNARVDMYQIILSGLFESLKMTKAIDPNTSKALAGIITEIDTVQAQLNKTSEDVHSVQITQDRLKDWAAITSAAGRSIPPGSPYSDMVSAVLTIISLVISLVASTVAARKKQEADKNSTALTEVVKGGQAFKASADESAVEIFKQAQAMAQSAATKEMVGAIKAVM